MPPAPNHESVVKEINRQHPHLLRHNTRAACMEFLQRVLQRLPQNEEWGHVGKSEGEAGFTLPSGVRVSHDVIFSKVFHRQVDIINGADGHPNPGGTAWHEIDPAVYRPSNRWTAQQPLFDSETPKEGSSRVAKLGRSWFPLLRGLHDWKTETLENFNWWLQHEDGDLLRVFLDVEGRDHIPSGSGFPDVWRDAGVDPRQPWWDDRMKEALDLVGQKNKQLWMTLYGGVHNTPTNDARRRLNDRIVRNCDGRWSSVFGFECANEYQVNRFDDATVQMIGSDLRTKVPAGTLIALSSPALAHGDPGATNEEIMESIEALYGHGTNNRGANVMTVHLNRDHSSRWADPFAYNTFHPHLKKINNEPRGQEASAGGDVSDPIAIVGDYKRTSDAGWILYVAHNAWGVWNGRLPEQYHHMVGPGHRVRMLKDQKNQAQVSAVLKEYRKSGAVVEPPARPPEGPPQPPQPGGHAHQLLSGQRLLPGQRLVSQNQKFYLEYQPTDGNLVIHEPGVGPKWASNTGGESLGYLEMQVDGNFVLYNAEKPIRASHTSGVNIKAQLNDDGALVLYDHDQPRWSSAANEFFS